MRFLFAVALPLAFQVVFTLGIISSTSGTGSFVGLGAMLGGLFAIPVTAQHNWNASDPRNGTTAGQQLVRIVLVTLIFPVLLVVLLVVAS